ncbi:MAG: 6,7-dimethyl-8-ribityllumazine synthase [Gammaproteobacteria bacterium]|nr:MAG: 6,7-dimethyl-8-ribityllumazine synthase [Gammaproteobacteria bacterium]
MSDFVLYDGTADLRAGNWRYGLVAARFNAAVVDRLLEGALDALRRHGAADRQLTVLRVPGAFELPLASLRLAESGAVDAVIALGCVIRGDTPHFDYVCAESARGLMEAGLRSGVPVIFGVLTTDTLEQAEARAGGACGNKGADAACAAMEMLAVLHAAHLD